MLAIGKVGLLVGFPDRIGYCVMVTRYVLIGTEIIIIIMPGWLIIESLPQQMAMLLGSAS